MVDGGVLGWHMFIYGIFMIYFNFKVSINIHKYAN